MQLLAHLILKKERKKERKIKLTGEGLVIRNCIIENPDSENSLDIAVEFVDKLNIKVDSD